MDGTGCQAHRAKRPGNVVNHAAESEEELTRVDWRMPLRQTFRQATNDRHYRIRGHFYAGLPDAHLRCRA